MPPKKKTADRVGVIYARYSSHNQKDASIEQQVAECMRFAEEQGITIIETYEDRAISGKSDRRPHFQRMMRDAEKGQFSYVLAWKSNRIGRNMLQAMMNEAKLNEWGIRCLYTEEDFDDTAAGRFALRSMMNVNQFYSENMAEDIRRGLMDNAAQCKVTNGKLPYGYKKGADMRYELDSPKDEIVREIYTRVANMEPLAHIVEDLNARGIKNRQGKPWVKGSFNALLTNERYRGIYIYDDIRIEGGVPRIISDELFFRVQEVLKIKKQVKGGARRNPGQYLLTGKLYCGKCKSSMVGVSGTGKNGTPHYYYVCNKRRHEKACDKKNVNRDAIEFAVAEAIKKYALNDEMIDRIAEASANYFKKQAENNPVAELEAELAEVNTAINNMVKAIEAGIITETTRSRLLELEEKKARLAINIEDAKADILIIDKEDIKDSLEYFRDGNIENKSFQQKLFDTFLIAVFVYDDKLTIQFSFTDTDNDVIDISMDDISENEDDSSAGEVFDQAHLCSTKKEGHA